MPAKVRFVMDRRFEENLLRASNKTHSSLHSVYDKVRSVTDDIAKRAKNSITEAHQLAEQEVDAIRGSRWSSNYGGVGRKGWLQAKARAFAFKSAASSVFPTMGYNGHEIYGRVVINRRGSASLEYGGVDPVAEIGKGTGEFLEHPAYGFLRRAMR